MIRRSSSGTSLGYAIPRMSSGFFPLKRLKCTGRGPNEVLSLWVLFQVLCIFVRMYPYRARWVCQGVDEEMKGGTGIVLLDPSMRQGIMVSGAHGLSLRGNFLSNWLLYILELWIVCVCEAKRQLIKRHQKFVLCLVGT